MSKKHRKKAVPGERQPNLYNRLAHISSRLRFSLTFRIALHYCSQLLRTVFSHALIVTLSLLLGASALLYSDLDCLRSAVLAGSADAPASLWEESYAVQLSLMPDADWYDTGELLRMNLSANASSLPYRLTVLLPSPRGGLMKACYRLSPLYTLWVVLMAGVLLSDLVRMLYLMRHHHRLDERVLSPIRDMTELAATLSANNLSNRINVAGTKDELKDLAVVINSMLDRIERSYNSQKQFVSDASHELRTPIAVIQGYVNMLKRWGKDDPNVLDEGLAAISQETASMKELVENLLFLARHDKKTLMLEMETFDPCDMVSELYREAQMVTPGDHFELLSSDHCTIEADRGMIKQVMRILLDNAVKYTPPGGTIGMGVYATPNGCSLVMKDNGAGIPGDELAKIFDRFYRSDSARKAETGGHGLGLSIARIIVVAHGGKIRVRSKVGEGTVFSVLLPAHQTIAPAAAEPPAAEEQPPKKLRRRLRKKVNAA